MKKIPSWEKDGYRLRLAKEDDVTDYYANNYVPLDQEVARMTGSRSYFAKEEVEEFFLYSVAAADLYMFVLEAPDGHIVGESVIDDIDWKIRKANFRIAIFHAVDREKGLGSWMVEKTRDFALEELNLHRLDLNVFSFNPRAERVYQKAGFVREGVLRDAVMDGDRYADDILMAIVKEE